MLDGKPCGRDSLGHLINGVSHCLMHVPLGKDSAAFQEEFNRILKEAGKGVADFTKFVFPQANYVGWEFKPRCVFFEATFTMPADFSRATFAQAVVFGSARFTQSAHFHLASFADIASFHGVAFGGRVNFDGATFAQRAEFVGVKFARHAQFRETVFRQESEFKRTGFSEAADFNKAQFLHKAFFDGVTFGHGSDFTSALFKESASFRQTAFAQGAGFWKAEFRKDADFVGSIFSQRAHFNATKFAELVDFARAQFLGSAEFDETRFREDGNPVPGLAFSRTEFSKPETVLFQETYLGQALIHNCDVSKITFSSVKWRQRRGTDKRMVFEEDVDLNHPTAVALRPKEGDPNQRDYGLIAEVYQQLKKNYDDRKDYWTAGDFHFGEMEMKRLSSRRKNRILRWLHRNLGLVAWYRYASHYGESYLRPGVLLVATLLLFAALFPVAGLRYDPAKDGAWGGGAPPPVVLTYWTPVLPWQPASDRHRAQWRLFENSCLTSLQIAAFQKEPAYQPVLGRGRLLAVLEMLLTSTLAALFFLAVNRQFRR
jgi:hypothetical protein